RLLARALRDFLARPRPSGAPGDFRALAVSRYGETLSELFLLGYTRKLWGLGPRDLSPAVAGGRLKGLGVGSLLADRILGRRARHLDGACLCPREGIGALTRALEARIRARIPREGIATESRVVRLRHDGARILSLTTATPRGPRE